MAVLDGTIANVSLPTIARELGVDPAVAIWVVSAYQLAITASLLPLAALGDRLGHRKVYLVGLALFTLGSLGCALSRTLPALITARVFQGFGAGGIMSVNGALVRFTWPERLLGRGIGLNAVVISISAAVGPTVAAAVLGWGSWEWLFAINLPIGLVAIPLGAWALPRSGGSDEPFDGIAALLSAIGFGALILGAETLARGAPEAGIAEIAIGAVAGALLLLRERGEPAPLIPLDLLKIPIFGLSIAASVVSFGAQMLAYVALPFHFQSELGYTAAETGLLMTPWPLAVGVAAPIAGRLSDRFSAGALGGLGLGVLALGLGLLGGVGSDPEPFDIGWRMAVCGIGFGLFQAPNNRAIVSSAPLSRSGAASGTLSTARLLGQTAGAATAAVLFHLAQGRATGLALGIASAVALAAALVSALRLPLARGDRGA